MKKNKGSLTVEAIIAFTTFLSVSFLLLNIVKIAIFSMVLDNATMEATKQIATAAYPIGMFNGAQESFEEKIQEEPISLAEAGKGTVNQFLEGVFQKKGSQQKGKEAAVSYVIQLLSSDLMGQVADAVTNLKTNAASALVGKMIEPYISTCGMKIDTSKLMIRFVKLPQTDREYANQSSYVLQGTRNTKTITFGQDDVVICTEYPYEVALPLLPAYQFTIRSVAVERAWLKGCGTVTSRKEGLADSIFGKDVVYIATGGNGKCYHANGGCFSLWTSGSKVALEEAKEQGKIPCKHCNPPS